MNGHVLILQHRIQLSNVNGAPIMYLPSLPPLCVSRGGAGPSHPENRTEEWVCCVLDAFLSSASPGAGDAPMQ